MNKYQKALLAIKETVIDEQADGFYQPRTVADYNYWDVNLLQELVDNPPLKFEDLNEGMWIWDDKNKLYMQIDEDFDEGNGNILVVFHEDSYNLNCERTKFEENRFYRREVQQ